MRLVATAILYDRFADHAQTERMIASCEKIGATDFVIGVDKKSIAGTVDWLRSRLGRRGRIFEFTWRDDYGWARNLTLARVPKKADWVFWVDSDDEIRSEIDVPAYLSGLPEWVGAVMCPYDYGRDEHGNRTTNHDRLRFLRWNVKWSWRNLVHEDVHSEPMQKWDRNPNIVWVHDNSLRDNEGTVARNLRILKKALQKDPKEARTWYYLGNAYFSDKQWAEAARCYEQYVGMSGWDDERWAALIYAAIAYREIRLNKAALNADLRAMELRPEYPDSYLGLAYTHANMNDWNRAKYWAELCVHRIHQGTIPPTLIFVNEKAYKYDPYALLAAVYFNLGENEMALRAYDLAIAAVPDEQLKKEREHLQWGIRRFQAVEKGLQLAAHLMGVNEPLKAKAVLDHLPAGAEEQFIEIQRARANLTARIPTKEEDVRAARMRVERPEVDVKAPVTPETQPEAYWLGLHLKDAKRVLMIGVPTQLALHVARQGIEVVGTDVDPSRTQEANRVAMRARMMKSTRIEGVRCPLITRSSTLQFHFCPPDDLGYTVKLTNGSRHAVRDLGPFDAVVVFDLQIAPDPDKVLAQAESVSKRVIVMVPDGAYDGPQSPDGSSLRMWSQMEFGRYLFPRGLITDLHTILGDTSTQGTIVAQYQAGKAMGQEPPCVIWCFDTGQRWSPDSLWRGGIGGSETAVIHMGEQMTKAGYRVTVFAEAEGVWNGVLYRKVRDFSPYPCKVFISWRSMGVLPQMTEFADHRFLWMHDTDIGAIQHKEQLHGVTILGLSDWQIGHLQKVYPGASIVKSGNGIVPERFDQKVKRVPYRLIWASSPDRGLEPILHEWPKIKAEFPKATLHVFYGFDMVRRLRPAFMAKLDKLMKQDGITVFGRVDQTRLAREYLAADVLVYQSVLPDASLFHETYCIMVVEAQAAGCVPITHSHGALSETNHTGIQTDDVWAALRAFWKMPKREQDALREAGKAWARQQTWEKVRDGWLRIIEDQSRLRDQGPSPSVEAGPQSVGESEVSGNGSGGVAGRPQFARGPHHLP